MNTFKHREKLGVNVGDRYHIISEGTGFSTTQGDITIEKITDGIVQYRYTRTNFNNSRPIKMFNCDNMKRVM